MTTIIDKINYIIENRFLYNKLCQRLKTKDTNNVLPDIDIFLDIFENNKTLDKYKLLETFLLNNFNINLSIFPTINLDEKFNDLQIFDVLKDMNTKRKESNVLHKNYAYINTINPKLIDKMSLNLKNTVSGVINSNIIPTTSAVINLSEYFFNVNLDIEKESHKINNLPLIEKWNKLYVRKYIMKQMVFIQLSIVQRLIKHQ